MEQDLEKIIADFEAETGRKLEIRDGRPYYRCSLYVRDSGITSLPEGLTVGGFLDLCGTGITSLPEGLVVGGFLDLEDCTGITSLPKDLTVGGYLYLQGVGITSLPEGLTVGDSIYLSGTRITSLPDGLTVGDSIYLSGTGITSLPEGLIVGGDLDLHGTRITSLPEGLTVGGDLYLRGTDITDTSNVTLTLSAEGRKKINDARNRPITWQRDDKAYIKVDGMFTEVDSHHGNVYRVHKVGSNRQLYLVTDGDNHWAHGDTLQEARADLIYKINDRDTSMYEGMTLDDTLTFEESIAAYRTITGACSPGTRDYIANRLPKPHKSKYSIGEIITLTNGEYGSGKFKEFFGKL